MTGASLGCVASSHVVALHYMSSDEDGRARPIPGGACHNVCRRGLASLTMAVETTGSRLPRALGSSVDASDEAPRTRLG